MTSEQDLLEAVRGGKSIFHDLGDANADAKLLKAQLAAEIIKSLDERGLSPKQAAAITGVTPADISRIRNANLGRFSLDRLVRVLGALDHKVELTVTKIRA